MARTFNGTSDRLGPSTTTVFVTGHSYSLSAWVNPSTGAAGTPCAFGFGFLSSGVAAGYAAFIGRSASSWLLQQVDTGGSGDVLLTGGAVTTNAWSHIGATYAGDGGGKVANLFLNGAQVATHTMTGTLTRPAPKTFANAGVTIGNDWYDTANFWNGGLGECAMWNNFVLTTAEFSALANGARAYNFRSSRAANAPVDGLASPEPDYALLSQTYTVTGTTGSIIGPPIMPLTRLWVQFPAPVAVTFKSAWALGKNVVVEGVAT